MSKILLIGHDFQHVINGAGRLASTYPKEQCFEFALMLFSHETCQAQMLTTTILGRLAAKDDSALRFPEERVGTGENWRVQEMLVKAFDEVCRHRGYEVPLPLVEGWITDDNSNVIHTVTEGLRTQISHPYFKENPLVTIALIIKHRAHGSKYPRKSTEDALRNIGRKHTELVWQEVKRWGLSNPRTPFIYKLATELLE